MPNSISTFFVDYQAPAISAAWLNAVNNAVFMGTGTFASMTDEGPFQSGSGFTGGVTTQLTLSQQYGNISNLSVWFDGVYQGWDTMSVSGLTLTFNNPIPVGVSTVYIKGGVVTGATTPVGGATGSRPANPAIYSTYFDTTLGQPIFVKSLAPVVWVNAAGVTV